MQVVAEVAVELVAPQADVAQLEPRRRVERLHFQATIRQLEMTPQLALLLVVEDAVVRQPKTAVH
jgi:hypothetical protein